jgi:hypothetical protein
MNKGEKEGILDIIDVYIESYEEFENPIIAVETVIKDLKILKKVVEK